MSDPGRFDNRHLPADLFRASITGKLPFTKHSGSRASAGRLTSAAAGRWTI